MLNEETFSTMAWSKFLIKKRVFLNAKTIFQLSNLVMTFWNDQSKPTFAGWARKKFPPLKIHSFKSTSKIWMIQILVKSQKIEVSFVIFLVVWWALEM